MFPTRFVVWTFSVSFMIVSAGAASAQDYPNRPIRIISTVAGGGGDFVARVLAQGLTGPLGQPVIVENRGSGFLPGEAVSKAPADGYTLLVIGGSQWVGPLLRKAPYDAVNDFSAVSLITRDVYVLVVHPSLPVKSVKELIALAKARPGELNYSSSQAGGSAHLAMELFKSMAGANIVWVPYKGNALSVTGLIGGEAQMTITDMGLVMPHVKSGRLRALAVTSVTPSALTPGLPTVAATVSGYESVGMTGMFAPVKTPPAIINRLNQEVVRLLGREDVKEKISNAGSEVVGSSAEQFAATMRSDITRISKVIKDAGIKVE